MRMHKADSASAYLSTVLPCSKSLRRTVDKAITMVARVVAMAGRAGRTGVRDLSQTGTSGVKAGGRRLRRFDSCIRVI